MYNLIYIYNSTILAKKKKCNVYLICMSSKKPIIHIYIYV